MSEYIVALTGASGAVYGIRLLRELLRREHTVHLVVSEAAYIVLGQEMDLHFERKPHLWREYLPGDLRVYSNKDIGARIASGSYITAGMIVIPCTMATISGLACGSSGNLTERAADVMMKEKRKLIVIPRETPLNSIHLKNMLALSEMGVHIIPAMPAFYHKPQSIEDMVDFIVSKALDALGIENSLYNRYSGQE
ncbi:MAG: UbiX family flavin prenyltransferase [Syntrophomonadaceae bacterium]|jgi:4-hydroxy-3-polyprenylbenzoate decarboxylase|nr:UbiX family flavin prenyltransferase [Syntrophomonadaceae bacterium]